MKKPPNFSDGKSSRLQDALVFQIDERDIELTGVEETRERYFGEGFPDGADTNSAPGVFESINELQSVLAILRACLPEAKNLSLMEQQLLQAAEQAAATAVTGAEYGQFDPQVEEISAQVASIEEGLIETERKIPLSWLRHQLDERNFGDMALAHYLRFHVRHLKISTMSYNRIDLLVSRLVSRRDHLGILRLRSAGEVAELLRACVPESDTPPHVRNAGILFFRNASQRLDELERGEDLFDEGFYVDILGYKLSLREEYFDARLLYTAAELDIAIENWLVHTHGMNLRTLDPQFAEARDEVRRIFNNNAGDVRTLTAQWNREFSSGEMPRASTGSLDGAAKPNTGRAGPLPWRKFIAVAVLLLGIIYIAPMVMDLFRTSQRNLKPVSTAELQAISPILVDGAWAGQAPSRIFIGHVAPEAWKSSKNPERRQAAQVIRDQLRYREVAGGLLYMSLGVNETLVVNIMEGEIFYVQPYIE